MSSRLKGQALFCVTLALYTYFSAWILVTVGSLNIPLQATARYVPTMWRCTSEWALHGALEALRSPDSRRLYLQCFSAALWRAGYLQETPL